MNIGLANFRYQRILRVVVLTLACGALVISFRSVSAKSIQLTSSIIDSTPSSSLVASQTGNPGSVNWSDLQPILDFAVFLFGLIFGLIPLSVKTYKRLRIVLKNLLKIPALEKRIALEEKSRKADAQNLHKSDEAFRWATELYLVALRRIERKNYLLARNALHEAADLLLPHHYAPIDIELIMLDTNLGEIDEAIHILESVPLENFEKFPELRGLKIYISANMAETLPTQNKRQETLDEAINETRELIERYREPGQAYCTIRGLFGETFHAILGEFLESNQDFAGAIEQQEIAKRIEAIAFDVPYPLSSYSFSKLACLYPMLPKKAFDPQKLEDIALEWKDRADLVLQRNPQYYHARLDRAIAMFLLHAGLAEILEEISLVPPGEIANEEYEFLSHLGKLHFAGVRPEDLDMLIQDVERICSKSKEPR